MKKIILVSFLIILSFSCNKDEDPYYAYDIPYEEYATLSYDATGIKEANIKTVNGNLSVNPSGDNIIYTEIIKTCWGSDLEDAKAHISDIQVIQGLSGGGELFSIEATMPTAGPYGYSASLDVDLPDSVMLVLTNANGSIVINSWNSDVYCSSMNGNIAAINHLGSLRVLITNGAISVSTLMLDSLHFIELGATNGDISIALPADIPASFNAGTTNGLVTISGFENVEYQVNAPNQKIGKIGGGGAGIDVSTVNGNISIFVK